MCTYKVTGQGTYIVTCWLHRDEKVMQYPIPYTYIVTFHDIAIAKSAIGPAPQAVTQNSRVEQTISYSYTR